MTDDITVTFIIPEDCRNESDCNEDMQLAFTTCCQHSGGGLKAQWIREGQWQKFEGLGKRDVFVLSEFRGDLYEKLRATKCLLVGPRCLSCCLTEGIPIPSGPEPVFTVAMRGLVVTCSGLSKQDKDNMSRKVHCMGGIYSTVLTDETTHLVSNTVLSDKYIKSVEKGIPIMSEAWVEAVWEASLHLNINGSSPDFNEHKLPIFANLQVTTSGISKRDKQMIMKMVNEHGGTFTGAFQSETTDIVILTKEGVGSEKYKAAVEYNKACVLPAWVKDSVGRGAALSLARYRVAGASTSSPLAEHRLPDMSLNFSRITNLRPPSNFIDETRGVDNNMSTISGKIKLSQDVKKTDESLSFEREIQTLFENFDMGLIKKAGPIFDGFCIWLTGIEGISLQRATAMVSRLCGIRHDSPHVRVTHTICGTKSAAISASVALPNVPVLSAKWLIDSVVAGKTLDEALYVMDINPATPKKAAPPRAPPASPLSRRNLQLLRKQPSLEGASEPEPEPVCPITQHYLSQNMPEEPQKQSPPKPAETPSRFHPDVTSDVTEEPTEEVEQIFRGIKMVVQGLDEEAICEIGAEITAAGGLLTASGSGGTHVLVPLEFNEELTTPHAEAITVFWVKDCLIQQELLPIQYYHRPVRLVNNSLPLAGVVASLSTYSGVERNFLDELAKLLGATTQLRFCRRNTANALASTHLICPTPSGDKYLGALKWGLPAVSAEWLLSCARLGARVSEADFLIGDTKAPLATLSEADKTVNDDKTKEQIDKPKEQSEKRTDKEHTDTRTDKENTMLPPINDEVPRRNSLQSKDNTPKARQESEMSPASRYIAMARQGLLGDSQETPKRLLELKGDARQEGEVRTPPLDDALSTPNLQGLSPTTRRRVQAVKRGEMPSDPIKTPVDPFDKEPATPDSAFGAALRPGAARLSPVARKRLWTVVNELPTKSEPPQKQTPLSEIRNRFLAQFNSHEPPNDHQLAPRKLQLQDDKDTPPSKMAKLAQDQSAGSCFNSTDQSTPKSALPSKCSDFNQTDTTPKQTSNASSSAFSLPAVVDAQLQRLSAALSGRSAQKKRPVRESAVIPTLGPESEPGPESQPNTVGWDDTRPTPPAPPETQTIERRFMLSSNVDNREELIEMIAYLGGTVVEDSTNVTHLLCALPGRSEKVLGGVAAGRWILHPGYVARSRAVGHFVDEEEFEWGNPLATSLPPVSGSELSLARAAHRWRAARGRGAGGARGEGPFCGVRAGLHVPAARRLLLARLLAEGGGEAVEDEPPYSNTDMTVCFADTKRLPLSERDAHWLRSNRIPVCAPVLLSSFLTEETRPDPRDHCLPGFRVN